MIGEILAVLKQQMHALLVGEIIVVGSDRPGLVIEDELVRFTPTEPSHSFASDKRNLGMQLASGEILLFLDDDCLPGPGWLARHLYQHQQGKLVVGGAVTFDIHNYFQLADNVSAFHDLLPFTPAGPRPYLATANLSIHRLVVERAGEMEVHQNRADDLEWTVRFRDRGYTLYFDPVAIVWHNPARQNFRSVWRHWTEDAPNTLRVRLKYSSLLCTPRLAKVRAMYLWCSPFVAAWATLRTFAQRDVFFNYWHTFPLVYLTKLAWCWSAFAHFPAKPDMKDIT
jgi:GT2 family glycosyltransferase